MSKENKTTPGQTTVKAYLKTLSETERTQAKELIDIFTAVTKAKPTMWGMDIVGFGSYHYTYDSGREGDWLATGFAIRKSGPTLYIMSCYSGDADYDTLLEELGPHRLGKSCLYLKSLADVDVTILKRLIRAGLIDLKKTYPVTM